MSSLNPWAGRFYIADESDPTYATPLVDFMDYIPGGTGFNVADGSLDLGQIDPQNTFLHQPPASGGILATGYYPEATMTFRLLAVGLSYQAVLDRVLALDEALMNGGVIVWNPPGASGVKYIDFYPSSISQLFRGQNWSMQKLVNMFFDPDGVPVTITRFPFLRGPNQILANAVTVGNDSLGGDLRVTNPGNAISPMKLTINPTSGGAQFVQARVGKKSRGNLNEFETLYQFDPTVDLTTLPKQWRRVWKKVITPTDVEGLIGNYRVLCAMKLLTLSEYRFQLRWSNVNQSPAGAVNDVIDMDNTDYTVWPDMADIPMGKIRFDNNGSALVLEMWAMGPNQDNPVANFGTCTLLPADEGQSDLTMPGFKSGHFSKEEIWGEMWDLSTNYSHLMNDDTVRLFGLNGYCEYALGVLPAGQHIVEFQGHMIRGAQTSDDPSSDTRRFSFKLGEIQVIEAGSLLQKTNLRVLRGYAYTQYDRDNPRRVIWNADGSSSYKVKVLFTDNAGSGRRIMIHKVNHWFMPFCDNGRNMVMDSYERECYVSDEATNGRWMPLHDHGGLMKLSPGDNLLIFRFGAASKAATYHDVDERGPRARVPNGMQAQITVEVTPFYTS